MEGKINIQLRLRTLALLPPFLCSPLELLCLSLLCLTTCQPSVNFHCSRFLIPNRDFLYTTVVHTDLVSYFMTHSLLRWDRPFFDTGPFVPLTRVKGGQARRVWIRLRALVISRIVSSRVPGLHGRSSPATPNREGSCASSTNFQRVRKFVCVENPAGDEGERSSNFRNPIRPVQTGGSPEFPGGE